MHDFVTVTMDTARACLHGDPYTRYFFRILFDDLTRQLMEAIRRDPGNLQLRQDFRDMAVLAANFADAPDADAKTLTVSAMEKLRNIIVATHAIKDADTRGHYLSCWEKIAEAASEPVANTIRAMNNINAGALSKYNWLRMRSVFGLVVWTIMNRGDLDPYAYWRLRSFAAECTLQVYMLWLTDKSNNAVHADFKVLRDVAMRLEDTPKPEAQTLTVAGVEKLQYLIAAAYATSALCVTQNTYTQLLLDFLVSFDEVAPHVGPQIYQILHQLKFGRDAVSRVVKPYVLWVRSREGLRKTCRQLRENPAYPRATQDIKDIRAIIGTLTGVLEHPVALPNLALMRRDVAYFRESLP